MSRALHKLTAVGVRSLPPGKYSDGGGLWLHRREDGGAQWFVRVTVHGRRREMGLGPVQEVSLKQARDCASEARQLARQGIDPIKKRAADRRAAERNLHVLRDVALDAFEARKAELKGDGEAGRWLSPLQLHVLPKLGGVPVGELTQVDIRDCLAPIWHAKADTARKAITRLSIVLRHAAALGLDVDLQAVDKAKALLGRSRHQPAHIEAMAWPEVPRFYRALGYSPAELALRLLILSAMRSAPVRLAQPEEFDLDKRIWTVPADHLKGRKGQTKDFRVPLCEEAAAVVREALRHGGHAVFAGIRGGPISDMTMSKHMRTKGLAARPHGFRASFRTWAEETGKRYEVAEAALGHSIGNRVERSYQRSDLLEERRVLMDSWARHVTSEVGVVVPLPGAAA